MASNVLVHGLKGSPVLAASLLATASPNPIVHERQRHVCIHTQHEHMDASHIMWCCAFRDSPNIASVAQNQTVKHRCWLAVTGWMQHGIG